MTAKDMEAPHRPMFLALSVEDPNGNDIACCSDTCPDSLRANSSLSSSSRTSSPANVKTVEDCINQVTSTGNVIKQVLVRADKTDILNCVKTVSDNCNHDVAFMVLGLQNGNVYSEVTVPHIHDHITQRRDRGLETCLKSESQHTLDMRSCCASSGTCSSVSSEEMLIRSNSFTLHESDQVLSASDLQESSVVPSDVGLMPDLLPDVCEGLVSITNVSPDDSRQEFGITFIQTNNQTFIMEEDVFQTVPAPLGPLKSSGGSRYSHLISGDVQYECTTPVDLKKSHAETLTPTHSTPAEGKTFHVPVSEELDMSGNVKTSTPVQSLSSKTFCLPSLSDSPPKKDKSDLESPMAQVMMEQQTSVQQKSKTPLTAPSKNNKVEGKKFAKPDFSNIKSKIMSRSTSISKPSSVSVMKASSNITQQAQKNPIRKLSHFMQRKTPTKSSFSVSSSHTVTTCSSMKTEQNSVTKRTLSSTCQDGIPTSKSRPRTWSETSSSSKTAGEDLCVKELQVSKTLESFTNAKTSSVAGLKNLNALSRLSKEAQQVNGTHMWKKHQKTNINTDSSQPVEADWGRSSLGPQTSSSRTGGASSGQTPAGNPRPSLSASKLKHGTAGKNGCATDMPSSRSKLSTSGGNLNMHLTEGTGAEGSRFTPAATQPPTSASKLSVKPRPQLKSSSASSGHTKTDLETFSGGKHPSNKAVLIRTRLQSLPPKAPKSGCKNTPQTSLKSAASILKTAVTRPVRVANTSSVDKNKAKASLQTQQQGQRNGHPDLVPPETKPRELEYYKALCERKNQTIQQLKNSLLANNHRFEAITVVVQTLCTQHEEAVKRRRELSVELLNLREELVSSAQSRELLEKEKDELNVTFSGVLEKVQEQHRSDLTDLEERLKSFYSAEWEKVHQTYQEEADKYKAQIDQQLKALRAKHETIQKELEASHEQEVKSIKQNYEESLEEIRKSHEQDMQVLEKTQKDMEATLSNQIEELSAVNHLLNNRLQEEQGRRRELAEKCQKDSHMLYLEQELESLKVVLDIKNKQIHQQDKKLLQLDKLIEKNVKLEECLTKVQQENEDLKARMDRHAALSRQLSTEQAVLQESLQKETKVNKRLSMENEELLWKLQNGDVSSPRKISPSSPSMTRQSPRHSGLFSSPPLSPR